METCETKSVLFAKCATDQLCMCAGMHDQENLVAQAIPQHPPKTSMPFNLPSDTFMVVVAKVVVACIGASKVMTEHRVCTPESQPPFCMHRAVPKLRTPRPVTAQVSEGAHLAG
jgi:hypothetical protein